jgi:hypothetical protein
MASRAYTLNFQTAAAPAAAMPIVQIVPATTIPVMITEFCIGVVSSANTAGSNTLSEVTFMRRSTASTTGTAAVAVKDGTASTATSGVIAPISELSPLSQMQVGAALTAVNLTVAGTVSATLNRFPFNISAGFFWSPIPDNQIYVKGGGFFTIQFTNVQTGLTYAGYVGLEEIV